VKNEIEKISVHNVSKDASKCSAMHVKNMSLREIYCTCVINEVEKMSVHSVSENTRKCSAMYVRSILLRVIILAVQKMHLNEIHFSRRRNSQFESENLRSHDDETLIHRNHNVVIKQLNSVAETVDCKQLISHAIVRVLINHETTYNSSSKFVIELIKILQQEDEFAVKLKADETTSIHKNDVKA
jgi:hypothetical protein